MTVHDVLILGAGPSGLALSAACAAVGLDTACVSPRPDQGWTQRFGAWNDELTPLLEACVEADWAAPSIVTRQRGEQILDRRYATLDTPLVQQRLLDAARGAGVFMVDGRARMVEHSATGSTVTLEGSPPIHARLVVDCTGPGTFVERPDFGATAYQAAYGELIEVEDHPFDMGEMVLMDWRQLSGSRPTDPPTFLYALPLGRNHLFVEETSLIGRPSMTQLTLRSRLSRRLQRWKIQPKRTLEVENCLIPMNLPLPKRDQRLLAFGTAASMIHPATGFSLARVLQQAPTVASAVAQSLEGRNDLDAAAKQAWESILPRDHVRCWELYAFGARFLTTLDQTRVEDWFETFFALSVQDWGGFMSATLTSSQLAQVMTRMYAALDPRTQWDLMRAGAGRHGISLVQSAVAH